jgi:hypothetical protein
MADDSTGRADPRVGLDGTGIGDFILGTPQNLGPQVNSSDFEYDPAV